MQDARYQLRQCGIVQVLWNGGGEAFDDLVHQLLLFTQTSCCNEEKEQDVDGDERSIYKIVSQALSKFRDEVLTISFAATIDIFQCSEF